MIIEGLLTTTGADGLPHVAPMGPVVNETLSRWVLRPFQTSTTFTNLQATPTAIFHIVDDVLPIVQAALGREVDLPTDALDTGGFVIRSACRWFKLEVTSWNTDELRSEAAAHVVDQGELRPFWGWNRAKHAVLEATILMTRRHLIAPGRLLEQISALESAVTKTAGSRELEAWQLLNSILRDEE